MDAASFFYVGLYLLQRKPQGSIDGSIDMDTQ